MLNNSPIGLTSFIGGAAGDWEVCSVNSICGDALALCSRLDIVEGQVPFSKSSWMLQGIGSNLRYTHKEEVDQLQKVQPPLKRKEATLAALIPIKKSDEWWLLAQDERRKIIEEKSAHIKTGMTYLPAIARKLYHSRDLGGEYDFITWFEFAPPHESDFNELLKALRQTEEWKYVMRETDIRLKK